MMPTVLLPLASHLWQSTLFGAAVWVLALALRQHRAAVRYWLWLAVSVKFLVPFSVLVNIGGQLGWRSGPSLAQPRLAAAVNELSQSLSVPARISPMISASTPGSDVATILLAVWGCGMLVGIVYWARMLRKFRAVRLAATPLGLNVPIPVLSSASHFEPGVFGIFKPVLILPAGITARLTPTQLEAVIAHELCHVRRRDNLTAAIHMIVETIFWFHPLVWWIRTRLIVERERACDEHVVQVVGDPQIYAEGILSVCKLYVETGFACASGITGGDLKRRIQRIMARRSACGLGLTGKALLATAAAIAVAGPFMVGLVTAPRSHAQTQPAAALAFEVASVKPNRSMTQDMSLNPTPGGGLEVVNSTLRTLIIFAYDLRDDQISRGPSWLDADRYDIHAKAPAGTKAGIPNTTWLAVDDPLRVRLRTLLADRFHLAVHREMKEMPVLALMQEKGGAKLQPWKEGDLPGPSMHLDYTKLTCRKYSMQRFASVILAGRLGMAVIDKTGLGGEYNFGMTFQPDPPPSRTGAAPEAGTGPTFLEALHDQLGLKLERQKAPVDFLVIDHVEKPEAN